jgi:Gas vesicle protein K
MTNEPTQTGQRKNNGPEQRGEMLQPVPYHRTPPTRASGRGGGADEALVPVPDQRLSGDLDTLSDFAHELAPRGHRPGAESLPGRINADPDTVEHDLAKLVLALIELIRRLLEKQALRRVEAGSLSQDDIERLGEAFLKLDQEMDKLKRAFGLQDEDLNLNLGPLGDLMSE